MVLQLASNISPLCSCDLILSLLSQSHRKKRERIILIKNVRWVLHQAQACINGGNFNGATRRGAKNIILRRFSDEEEFNYASASSFNVNGSYYSSNFGEDPVVDKLRTQLGVIHPIPSPHQINRNIFGLFAFFFFVGVAFDKLSKVCRGGIENWIIGLLRPVIDNLRKPDYVQRVEIKQFSQKRVGSGSFLTISA